MRSDRNEIRDGTHIIFEQILIDICHVIDITKEHCVPENKEHVVHTMYSSR